MSVHTCHVPGCAVPVPPKMLMCRPHWAKVPDYIQRAVWAAFRNGQEVDKRPSRAWLAAAEGAIAAVQLAERPREPESRCSRCGAPTLVEFKVHAAITGGNHTLPEWRSEYTVHADDRTLANRAYCDRPAREGR